MAEKEKAQEKDSVSVSLHDVNSPQFWHCSFCKVPSTALKPVLERKNELGTLQLYCQYCWDLAIITNCRKNHVKIPDELQKKYESVLSSDEESDVEDGRGR